MILFHRSNLYLNPLHIKPFLGNGVWHVFVHVKIESEVEYVKVLILVRFNVAKWI